MKVATELIAFVSTIVHQLDHIRGESVTDRKDKVKLQLPFKNYGDHHN